MEKDLSARSSRFVVWILLLAVGGCSEQHSTRELSGSTMGTTFSVKIAAFDDRPALDALEPEITNLLEMIEQSLSTYRPTADLAMFNTHTGTDWIPVSELLCEAVSSADALKVASGGAFDPAVGRLVNLWGFGSDMTPASVPDGDVIKTILEEQHTVEADCTQPALKKSASDVHVDLSAWAKGYGVDRTAELLQQHGVRHYLVEIGGEVRAAGRNARGDVWRIAIESADRERPGIQEVVPLDDAAMATSGDYRIWFEEEGRFYSHTIDPRTGYPIVHDGAAVTVIADTAARADGLATALLVLGPDEGMRLAERLKIAAFFQLRVDGGIEERVTSRWRERLSEL